MLPHNPIADTQPQTRPLPQHAAAYRTDQTPAPAPQTPAPYRSQSHAPPAHHAAPQPESHAPPLMTPSAIACAALFSRCSITCRSRSLFPRTAETSSPTCTTSRTPLLSSVSAASPRQLLRPSPPNSPPHRSAWPAARSSSRLSTVSRIRGASRHDNPAHPPPPAPHPSYPQSAPQTPSPPSADCSAHAPLPPPTAPAPPASPPAAAAPPAPHSPSSAPASPPAPPTGPVTTSADTHPPHTATAPSIRPPVVHSGAIPTHPPSSSNTKLRVPAFNPGTAHAPRPHPRTQRPTRPAIRIHLSPHLIQPRDGQILHPRTTRHQQPSLRIPHQHRHPAKRALLRHHPAHPYLQPPHIAVRHAHIQSRIRLHLLKTRRSRIRSAACSRDRRINPTSHRQRTKHRPSQWPIHRQTMP